MVAKLISYCRVSTERQGASGLGLEAQEAAIAGYAKQTGGSVIGRFVEVESGKRSDRPELARALAHAKRAKATLIVAKLDRLARNVAFLSAMLEAGVEFIACDNPTANRLTVHILAAVAEAEAKAISERTKSALAAAKARGTQLGSARPGHWEGREDRRLAGAMNGARASREVRSKAAREAFADLLPIIEGLRGEGATLKTIADKLNGEGYTTRRGKGFTPIAVQRILLRSST